MLACRILCFSKTLILILDESINFWRGQRIWKSCGHCWCGNKMKPHKWWQWEPPKAVQVRWASQDWHIRLQSVSLETSRSRSLQFCLGLFIANTTWQSWQKLEGKDLLLFALFDQGKDTKALQIAPFS
jgi:hypothetical protein